MLEPWAENLQIFIGLFGAIGTIITIFVLPKPDFDEIFDDILEVIGSRFFSAVLAFLRVWLYPLLAISISAILLLAINLWGKVEPPPPSPSPPLTPTPSIKTTITPTLYREIKLYELPLLRVDEDAFFFQAWDQYEAIAINNVVYPQSIGVRIPEKAQEDYFENYNTLRKEHSALIEYSLAYKYKTLKFNYGIDDSSFPDDKSCVAQCHYWIVVQSCSAEDDHFEKDDLLFITNPLNYYQSLHSSGNIDVSGVEAVRITVYWEFDVIQTKPLAFNIAIINPTLYY